MPPCELKMARYGKCRHHLIAVAEKARNRMNDGAEEIHHAAERYEEAFANIGKDILEHGNNASYASLCRILRNNEPKHLPFLVQDFP